MVVFKYIAGRTTATGFEGACAGDGAAGVAGVAATSVTEAAVTDCFARANAAANKTIDECSDRLVDRAKSAIFAGAASIWGAPALSGPLLIGTGLILLGASNNSKEDGTTFDCWKQVIHDESKEPSRGMLLKDIYSHPNVLKVTATEGNHPDLPRIVIENIWNEVFEIEYLWVHATENIICHALPI